MLKVFSATLAGALIGIMIGAPSANAGVGYAHGIGPHLSNPATPHIGRFYYQHNGGSHSVSSEAEKAANVPTELDQFVQSERKARCDYLHARYALRHGVRTPQPLRGLHGCAKYAHDQRYWQNRHHTPHGVNTHQLATLDNDLTADVVSINQLF